MPISQSFRRPLTGPKGHPGTLPYATPRGILLPDMPATPSQSAEDYLERIHELIEEKGYARVVDIASSLNVKQASVTSMVQKLGEMGYLNYEKYRGLMLTDEGRAIAVKIQRRHETLARFFSLFKLDEKTQGKDIEGLEHHLSTVTIECFEDLSQFLEDNPEVLAKFIAFRKQSREQRKAGG